MKYKLMHTSKTYFPKVQENTLKVPLIHNFDHNGFSFIKLFNTNGIFIYEKSSVFTTH